LRIVTKHGLVEDENKVFESDYTYCNKYEWNRVPNHKIVVVYISIRHTNKLALYTNLDI